MQTTFAAERHSVRDGILSRSERKIKKRLYLFFASVLSLYHYDSTIYM